MNNQRKNNIQGRIVFDDNSQETKPCSCLGQSYSRILVASLSQLYVSLLIIFVCFLEFIFQKRVTNQVLRLELCEVQQDTIKPQQDYEQINSTETWVLISLVGPCETKKSQPKHN